MTKEQRRISTINHDKAEQYFIENGLMPAKEDRTCKGVLHHIDPSWKDNDIERYIQWNVEDLVPMTNSEHMKLHQTGEGNSMYGKPNPFEGKHHSEETKKKMSESRMGKVPWNKGLKGCYSESVIKGWSESRKGKPAWNKDKHRKLVDGKHVYYD